MAEKTIKLLQFWYTEEYSLPGRTQGYREVIARQGETHDITDPADLQRGEDLDAFYTDAELKAGLHQAHDPYAAAMTSEGEVVTEPLKGQTEGGMVVDWESASVDDMANFIEENKVTVNELVEVADKHPDRIDDLLEAEHQATGGNPRKGVTEGLAKIAERESE